MQMANATNTPLRMTELIAFQSSLLNQTRNLFHIKLSLINGDQWFALSKYKFKKEEAIKLASLFIGLTKHQAERVWISKKLGDLNTNILCHSY